MRWKKYIKAMLIGIQAALEYRVDFLLILVSCFFPILIQIFMWKALYGNSGETLLFNYSYTQMLIYAVLATVISKIISADTIGIVANDIKSGDLSKYLVKPISYFSYIVSRFIGDKIIKISALLVIAVAMLAIFASVYSVTFSLTSILLFILAIFIATVLKFMTSYLATCMTFWFTESGGVLHAVNLITLVLSGGYFPLDIFGPAVLSVLRVLPFYYTIYFPVNIINGVLPANEIAVGLAIQLGWIVALKFIIDRVWARGMRIYVSVGG